MKYRDKGQTPLVTYDLNQVRYTVEELKAAFPPVRKSHSINLPAKSRQIEACSHGDVNFQHAEQVAATTQAAHPELWDGSWQDAKSKSKSKSKSKGTGQPFASQSQAGMSMSSHIARECYSARANDEELFGTTLHVFGMSEQLSATNGMTVQITALDYWSSDPMLHSTSPP